MPEATATEPQFISTRRARARLGVSRNQLIMLMHRGLLTVQRLPGMHPRILVADLDRIAADSIRPATAGVK